MTSAAGPSKQRVAILGSTGSIGVSTLDVISRHPEQLEVFALSASTQSDKLLAQCVQFRPQFAVMVNPTLARDLADKCASLGLKTQVLSGAE
jgi:1-deoxy-D-xylulose-5-phosphate reductoisomerase